MEEVWKDIEGYEGLYKVSNLGNIHSIKSHYILKGSIDTMGYRIVNLSKNKTNKHFYIHRLVAKAFIPNPDNKPQVNHIDGNKLNNNITNLEWVTGKENIRHASKNNLLQKNKKIYNKIKEIDNGNYFKYTVKVPFYCAIPFNEILKEKGVDYNEWFNSIIIDIINSKYKKIEKYI